MTPYRSNEHAVASALEEQRELVGLERGVRMRRRRTAFVLGCLFCGVVGMIFAIGAAPARKRWACHQVEVRYEPQEYVFVPRYLDPHAPSSRVARPPETWQSCEWK
jgi:hypothetical protein